MSQCNKFFIDSEQRIDVATNWIQEQFQEGDFPYFDTNSDYLDKNNIAEIQFLCLHFNPNLNVNDWCEYHLNRNQWRRLKQAIFCKPPLQV